MSLYGTNIIDLPPAGPITGTEVVAVVQGGITSRTTASSIGGASTFIQLSDVPNSYSGQSGKVAAVNGAETGLEFVAVGGTGTVTSVSVVTANGVSGSVATATTTPAITLALGAITPTTIVASGAISGSNLSGTNTGDVTVTDSAEIDFTLAGQNITASLIAGSIDESKLDSSVNASLDLADSAAQFSFKTISVSGQSDVVADLAADTLTLVAGSNITITTNAGTDTITIAASGGGGGSSAFNDITSGTNTSAAMVVGTGASLATSGSGTISASTASSLSVGRTIGISGDISYTSPSFDGSTNVSAAGTLATVNSNIGSFGSSTSIPSFTVNGKGLITAASGNAVIAPAGTLTGTTLASGVTASSLASVGTITTGVWNGTDIAVADGGTGASTASSARTNLGLSSRAISFGAVTPGNDTVYLSTYAPFAFTINSVQNIQTSSGTITAAVKINGTNVTGLSAIAVTSSSQDVNASGANSVVVGDEVTLVLSSNSSAANLRGTILITM